MADSKKQGIAAVAATNTRILPQPAYCPQCGIPTGTSVPHGAHYDDKADAAKAVNRPVANQDKPFTLKGK